MFLSWSALSTAVGTTAGFVAGGAAGVVLARFIRARRNISTRSTPSSRVRGRPADRVLPESPALARRMRTGRLPLPQRVTDLTPADEPGSAHVNAFVDRLVELPIGEWLAIGRRQIDAATAAMQHATAFAILEATIGVRGLGVAAWYVYDAVETSAFLATNSVSQWTAGERRVFSAAHAAAEDAALALLARDKLAPEDFATLVAPFEHLLPSDSVL